MAVPVVQLRQGLRTGLTASGALGHGQRLPGRLVRAINAPWSGRERPELRVNCELQLN